MNNSEMIGRNWRQWRDIVKSVMKMNNYETIKLHLTMTEGTLRVVGVPHRLYTRGLFCVKWEAVDRFVDIVEIVDHHSLKTIFFH